MGRWVGGRVDSDPPAGVDAVAAPFSDWLFLMKWGSRRRRVVQTRDLDGQVNEPRVLKFKSTHLTPSVHVNSLSRIIAKGPLVDLAVTFEIESKRSK